MENMYSKQVSRVKYDLINDAKSSFNKSYQIIWISDGNGSINLFGKKHNLSEESLFLIPIGCRYTIKANKPIRLLKIYIPQYLVNSSDLLLTRLFEINLLEAKTLTANFLYRYNKRADFNIEVECEELISSILKIAIPTDFKIKSVKDDRVLEALQYIEENLTNRFTINDIAAKLHINPTYLSTLFKNDIGITIITYTNTIRLEYALSYIVDTQLSITQIAYNCGFADVRTLNDLSKKHYNMTPRQIRQGIADSKHTGTNSNNVSKLINTYMDTLVQSSDIDLIITGDNESQQQFKNLFNCVAIGRAHDVLYANVQQQLIIAKSELNFKYCRFHNIFGDEMNIIDTDYNGNIHFNFEKPIRVIRFLLENNILPFIELGFFPKQVCNEKVAAFTGYNINVGGNINFDLWEHLIAEFIQTITEVFPDDYLSFRFDLWNEIDIKVFWPNSIEDFYKLYSITYKTIKEIDSNIMLGGFNYGNFFDNVDQITEDMIFLDKNNMLPNFLTIHSYPIYIRGTVTNNPDIDMMNLKPEYFRDKLNTDIAVLESFKEKYDFKELYITEWNTSPMQREALNDQIYKSSKVMAELINTNTNIISGICYWTLSDEMAEFGYPLGEVHGGFGLMTRNGLKKPSYYSYYFASLLKGNIIHSSRNCIITRDSDNFIIICNNDVDYERSFDALNVDNIPEAMDGVNLNFDLNININNKAIYKQTTYSIDNDCDLHKAYQSLFSDKQYLSKQDLNSLHQIITPSKQVNLLINKSKFKQIVTLQPMATTCIILSKQN